MGLGAQTPPYTSPSSGDWAGRPGDENICSLVSLQPKGKAGCHAHSHPRNNASINNCFNCVSLSIFPRGTSEPVCFGTSEWGWYYPLGTQPGWW